MIGQLFRVGWEVRYCAARRWWRTCAPGKHESEVQMPKSGGVDVQSHLTGPSVSSQAGVTVWQVALPGPLFRLFSYGIPEGMHPVSGARVRVPFGRGQRVGILWRPTTPEREVSLKYVDALLDTGSLLDAPLLTCLEWAASYYHFPLGEVALAAFPPALRKGQVLSQPGMRLTDAGRRALEDGSIRGSRQRVLLMALAEQPLGVAESALMHFPRATRQGVVHRGWAEFLTLPLGAALSDDLSAASIQPLSLNTAQTSAVSAISANMSRFRVWLLDGVTGSGKTEVYLSLIARVVAAGKQVLVLVPEIALTPQLVSRFALRLGAPPVVLHSALTDAERLQAWLAAQSGRASVVVGTRSAAFQPLANLGLVIVDEEHDASLKQSEGFGFHARDVVVWRARAQDVPVVLGSATPSLESLRNVQMNRYETLFLPERAKGARMPVLNLIDVRGQRMSGGLSPVLIETIERHLVAGGQALLYLNRRGYAPNLLCHDCGWVAACRHCDAFMTWHRQSRRLKCHHCGEEQSVPETCPVCRSELSPRGLGTEQLEDVLAGLFPDFGIERLDRDALNRKGELARRLARIRAGDARLIVGTQIVVKGHDFPDVSLVGVVDADQGLFANDFRGSERFAQQLTQVAGRAGRADRPGTVLVQTHHPDHPGLSLLLRSGYGAYAAQLLRERAEAGLPPLRFSALIRADGRDAPAPRHLLDTMASGLSTEDWVGLSVWGPVEAPLARRAGRFRYQLLLLADDRALLHDALAHLDAWIGSRRPSGVRWSIDVDPQDMA